MASKIGLEKISGIGNADFCVHEGLPEEKCACIFDFENIKVRDEWLRKSKEGYGSREFWLARSHTDSHGNIAWDSPAKWDNDPYRPWLTTDIPTLNREGAEDEVRALKERTMGNCYLHDVHFEGHLGANHIHIMCKDDQVSTPERFIPKGTLLDMVAATAGRIMEA